MLLKRITTLSSNEAGPRPGTAHPPQGRSARTAAPVDSVPSGPAIVGGPPERNQTGIDPVTAGHILSAAWSPRRDPLGRVVRGLQQNDPAHFFGVFMSVNPVLAALVGLVVLNQRFDAAAWASAAYSSGSARRNPPFSPPC
ncbi:hypothetical protein [Streptomyces sp. NPDC020681]|uniref:hypothetical protein n=1 Tax=Streptomyces sp. NPDC020681 TaxID=3365083 RepID=UPI0037B2D587